MKNQKILWIALFRGIGDAVLFCPALRRSMEIFKDAQMDLLLSREAIAEVFHLYGFCGKIRMKPVSALSWASWIGQMGLRSYDLVLDASSIEQMHLSRWLAWMLSKGDRVGYHYGSSSWLYTKKLNTSPIALLHQKEMYAHLLSPYADAGNLELLPPPESAALLESLNLPDFSGKRIVIHAGARDPYKQFTRSWPIERFVALSGRLSQREDVQIVMIGSIAEKNALAPFEKELRHPRIINLAGQTSIARHFGIIRSARLFVGNNSGPMHIAAAYKIPIVTFAGGIPMKRWGPPRDARNIVLGEDKLCPDCQEWNCDKDGRPCLEAISVEETYRAIQKFL